MKIHVAYVLRNASLAIALILQFAILEAFSQETPGLRETRKSGSSQSTFSYRIQSTYGATTSVQATGNLKAETEAILKLKSGSKVTNKIGDDNGNASAVFVATPGGGNVELTGITGENVFLLDDGTLFRSKLETIDNPDPAVSSVGTASATATHSTLIVVEKGSTTLENYFEQTF
jgi:hypothetical protein